MICKRWLSPLGLLLLGLAIVAAPTHASTTQAPATAVWRIGREPLQLQAAPGFAGAVSSIRFRGREYIDAADHGRELQGAVQFGLGECLNPTLAGASRDPPGLSSSELLSIQADGAHYRASTRMAYWARPGARCTLGPGSQGVAANTTRVSDLVYSQDMASGYEGHANAILTHIDVRSRQPRPPASVEVLTGYMPPDFDTFLAYDEQDRRFREAVALEFRSQERDTPLILATRDGRSAMGVIGLSASLAPHYVGFHSATVGKWSVVYRESTPFAPGLHRYACVWIIGTRSEVEATRSDIVQRGQSAIQREEALLAATAGALLLLGGAALVAWERRRRRPPVPL